MKPTLGLAGRALAFGAPLLFSLPAFAQEAAEAAAPVVDKGDTAWMMTSTVLVMAMIVPGLALFYGGLVRTKNMLSVLTQIIAVASLAMVMWALYGYTMAFGDGGNAFIAGFGKAFLSGITADSTAATFSDGFVIPEFVFIAFQMTFSAITVALVIGGLVERIKFSAVMIFAVIWLTIVYYPIAHMVWATGGLIFEWGALDFAGGTVVHINAGVSALVGAIILGKRIGYQKEIMAPHSLTMTLIGTGLLWVGWFGFNAGSALEANGSAGLALINTFLATATAVLFWMLTERALGHKSSLLGACSGAIAGLVAITPAAGNSGPMGAILLGLVAGILCCIFVMKIKAKLGVDESLDAFGIHAVGGIIGSILTAVTMLPSLGGPGGEDYAVGAQLIIQIQAVVVAVIWAGVGSAIAFTVAKVVTGLRVTEEVEREGLDLGEHGERAYNY
ncbi:ammonium transporter [Sphingosinicella microcystinivorans]|uniref:Ammonium transporter n=1 Tax=Sphingosinicella microcystinivorans TaxID=335406 RepID=A0AAD1D9F8_SPHMI|nr:ammonium transporter [Sphingosinicella microcystinivorans]RKS88189.1 ammonium transporter [Sphingosinicella microcystinivorans]BBE36000.1 ammonium transporter [Sphingosinicella microcystinivorans]